MWLWMWSGSLVADPTMVREDLGSIPTQDGIFWKLSSHFFLTVDYKAYYRNIHYCNLIYWVSVESNKIKLTNWKEGMLRVFKAGLKTFYLNEFRLAGIHCLMAFEKLNRVYPPTGKIIVPTFPSLAIQKWMKTIKIKIWLTFW